MASFPSKKRGLAIVCPAQWAGLHMLDELHRGIFQVILQLLSLQMGDDPSALHLEIDFSRVRFDLQKFCFLFRVSNVFFLCFTKNDIKFHHVFKCWLTMVNCSLNLPPQRLGRSSPQHFYFQYTPAKLCRIIVQHLRCRNFEAIQVAVKGMDFLNSKPKGFSWSVVNISLFWTNWPTCPRTLKTISLPRSALPPLSWIDHGFLRYKKFLILKPSEVAIATNQRTNFRLINLP